MKICRKCGRELPESRFNKAPRNRDGLKHRCKKCDAEYWKEYVRDFDTERKLNTNIGGFKIYILNYAKTGEFKYNIVSTKGEVFKTNDKPEFFNKLKETLC